MGTTAGTLVLRKGVNYAMRSVAFATTLAERGGHVVSSVQDRIETRPAVAIGP